MRSSFRFLHRSTSSTPKGAVEASKLGHGLAISLLLSLLLMQGQAQAAPNGMTTRIASGDDGATLPTPQPAVKRTVRKVQNADTPDNAPVQSRRPAHNISDADAPRDEAAEKGPPPPEGPPPAPGWPGGPRRHFHGGGHGLFGGPLDLSKLNLTDEQKQTIKQLRSQNAPKARELRQAIQAKRQEVRRAMFDPNATDDMIRSKRKELRVLQDQMEETALSDFLSMRNVLTPDQKKLLPELMPQPPRFAGGPPGPPPGPGDAQTSTRKKMVEGNAPPVD